MPLLDHFHPPLSDRRHWHAFHNSWATYLSSQLNALLPDGYFAEANVQYGIDIDVAAFEEPGAFDPIAGWVPPPPRTSVPLELLGAVVEVGIFSRSGGPTLAGAVELISPANKDRQSHRDALVSKCASYLQAGIGLVLVDVVTERSADVHRELLMRLGGCRPGAGRAPYPGWPTARSSGAGPPRSTSGRSRSPSVVRCRRCHYGCEAASACRSNWRQPTCERASSRKYNPPRSSRIRKPPSWTCR